MKIAVIRSECSYGKGGAERYAANLCRELATMGHQVWVLAEKFDPAIHPALIHVPVAVNRATSWSRNRSFHENSQRALARLEVDAVLALSRSFPSDAFRVSDPLHRFWMELRYPGRLNRFFQSLNPRHRAILELEKAIIDPRNTRMIITNSQLSKQVIRNLYDYPEDCIHVIYNGVDLEKFQPAARAKQDGPLQLLFVGQDFKRKGLAEVIDALAKIRAAGIEAKLRVVGRDKPDRYRARAEALGVAHHVMFEPPSGSIEKIYQQADLLVFPSLYDPFANVCLEALACGLPVITTTTNGSSEILTEGEEGYVIDGRDGGLAEAIAGKIMAFHALTAEARAGMKLHARSKAERFTVRANAERLVDRLTAKTTTA